MSQYAKIAMLCVVSAAVLLAPGCGPKIQYREPVNLVEEHYDAVNKMLAGARERLPRDARILVASFVDENNLTRTSPFGRSAAQYAAARLNQRGYNTVSMTLRKGTAVINPEGEFLLSRQMRELGRSYQARAVLVGTYNRTRRQERVISRNRLLAEADPSVHPSGRDVFYITDDLVYVSMRLISAEDNSILAAYDFAIPIDQGVESMLPAAALEEGELTFTP